MRIIRGLVALFLLGGVAGCLDPMYDEYDGLPDPQYADYQLRKSDLGAHGEGLVVDLMVVRPAVATLEYRLPDTGQEGCGSMGFSFNQDLPFGLNADGVTWVNASNVRPAVSTPALGLDPGFSPSGVGGATQGGRIESLLYPGQRIRLQLSLPEGMRSNSEPLVKVGRSDNDSSPFLALETLERIPFQCGTIHDFSGTYVTAGGGLPTLAYEASKEAKTANGTTAWMVTRVSSTFNPDPVGQCDVSILVNGIREASDRQSAVCNAAYTGNAASISFRVESLSGRSPHVGYFLWDGHYEPICKALDLFGTATVPCMPNRGGLG